MLKCTVCVAATAASLMALGCQRPEQWAYTGPHVYLIGGDAMDQSDGLNVICGELQENEINARVYSPDHWLKVIGDIDAHPSEDVILVGHGHGAFLATQVVRHYAQSHTLKFIKAVITIDAYNKDWPHNDAEAGFAEPHCKPMPIPIGHNALCVRNYYQCNPDSRRWGADLVSTRDSNLEFTHPFYWYDDWWNRRPVSGQLLGDDVTNENILHETIVDDPDVTARVIHLCRRAALSPFHYTPPEHHPDARRPRDTEPAAPGKTTA